MMRFCVLFCAMFIGVGCSSDSDKAQWDAFWKDVKGENMQMRGDFSNAELRDAPLQPK